MSSRSIAQEAFARCQTREATEQGPCWEWPARRSPLGYGLAPAPSWTKSRIVTRQVWALLNGPIADEACVLHRCDNPPCYRPSHLFIGTRADNVRDMIDKGRAWHPSNEAASRVKLTDVQVREIRRRRGAGESCTSLAAAFDVHRSHISRICRGLFRPTDDPAEIPVVPDRCKYGHDYTPENTYVRPDTGRRMCRACSSVRAQRRTAQRRALAGGVS